MRERAAVALIKNLNSSLILENLWNNPNSTIPEISRSCNLSVPTVTRTIQKCLEKDLILATELRGDECGRKAQCYIFNDNYCQALLVNITEKIVSVQVVLLNGRAVFTGEYIPKKTNIVEQLHGIIEEQTKSFDKIQFICITLSGHIRNGYVYASKSFKHLKGVDLKMMIESEYHINTMVMDSVKILPFVSREYYRDFAERAGILFLTLGEKMGFGAACCVRGVLFSGSTGLAWDYNLYSGSKKKTTLQQKSLSYAQDMIVGVNPDSVVLYADETVDVQKIVDELRDVFPPYYMPEVTIGKEFNSDLFLAMKYASLDSILDGIIPTKKEKSPMKIWF